MKCTYDDTAAVHENLKCNFQGQVKCTYDVTAAVHAKLFSATCKDR